MFLSESKSQSSHFLVLCSCIETLQVLSGKQTGRGREKWRRTQTGNRGHREKVCWGNVRNKPQWKETEKPLSPVKLVWRRQLNYAVHVKQTSRNRRDARGEGAELKTNISDLQHDVKTANTTERVQEVVSARLTETVRLPAWNNLSSMWRKLRFWWKCQTCVNSLTSLLSVTVKVCISVLHIYRRGGFLMFYLHLRVSEAETKPEINETNHSGLEINTKLHKSQATHPLTQTTELAVSSRDEAVNVFTLKLLH